MMVALKSGWSALCILFVSQNIVIPQRYEKTWDDDQWWMLGAATGHTRPTKCSGSAHKENLWKTADEQKYTYGCVLHVNKYSSLCECAQYAHFIYNI